MSLPGIFSSVLQVSTALAGASAAGSAALLSAPLAVGDLGVLGDSVETGFFPSWS